MRPYIKDGKINIEEVAVRSLEETLEAFESRIWDYIKSPYCTKEFTPRQAIHIKDDERYISGRSYYLSENDIPPSSVIQWMYAGELQLTGKGDWNKKVLIHHLEIAAVVVYRAGEEKATEYSFVHFSNKGLHMVPKEVKDK